MTHVIDTLKADDDLFKPSRAPWYFATFVLLLIAIFVGFWIAGTLDPWMDYVFPARAEAHGTVTLNGKPMTNGIVQSYLSIPGLMGGLAPIEKDGTFRLLTNGDPGVYCGEHKIIVSYMTNTFPPKSLLPAKYTDSKTTPFTFIVKRGRDNRIELVVEAPDLLKTEAESNETPQSDQNESTPKSDDSEINSPIKD